MTSYAQYPYETLMSVGHRLGTVSGELGSAGRGASTVLGLSEDQQPIVDGVSAFRDEWGESVTKLRANIGTFGELSWQIGTMVAGVDTGLAGAMRPGGQGGR